MLPKSDTLRVTAAASPPLTSVRVAESPVDGSISREVECERLMVPVAHARSESAASTAPLTKTAPREPRVSSRLRASEPGGDVPSTTPACTAISRPGPPSA